MRRRQQAAANRGHTQKSISVQCTRYRLSPKGCLRYSDGGTNCLARVIVPRDVESSRVFLTDS